MIESRVFMSVLSLQVKAFRRRLLLLLMLVLLLCTACAENRKGEEARADESGSVGGAATGDAAGDAPAGEAVEDESPGRVQLQLDQRDAGDQTDAGEGSADGPETAPVVASGLSVLSNPDPFGLPGGEIVRDTPADTNIGALQDLRSVGPQQEAVIRPAARFLEILTATSPENDRMDELLSEVSPERRDDMADWLRFSLDRFPAPDSARLGELRRGEADRAWMPVVLRRGGAAAAGELHLSLAAGRWYVTDLLVQFGDLAEESNEDLERFEPTEYPTRSPGL